MAFSGEIVNKVNKLPLASIQKVAAQLGIATCLEPSPKILIFNPQITRATLIT
jgi:hypothetical protein